jgi:galactokinase
VKTDAVETVKQKVGASYLAAVGHETTFYVSDVGDGAREVCE